MLDIFETLEEALQFLAATHQSKRFYSILYFESLGNRVSRFYVFTGEASSLQRLQTQMTEVASDYLVEKKVVRDRDYFETDLGAKLLRQFGRGMAVEMEQRLSEPGWHIKPTKKSVLGTRVAMGRHIEQGGHAEEELVRYFHHVYQEIQAQGPDSAVILNSHSPCTRADTKPSAPRDAPMPENPWASFAFDKSCTEKLNQLSTLVPIPTWKVYWRQEYGALGIKHNLALLYKRDAARLQHAAAEKLTIMEFSKELEAKFKQCGVPRFGTGG